MLQGTVRNKDLKITISNKTFYVDDVEKGVYYYDYPFTIHEPLSTVKIEERNGIEDEFIGIYNNNPKSITLGNGFFHLDVKKDQEHEIIKALEKIKSNMIDELKELGVEV